MVRSLPNAGVAASAGHPMVSVVMAVRNEDAHLEEAAAAVLAQDYPGGLELVIAVAPSEDATFAMADKLAGSDSRVRVVANPRAITPAGLNAAIEAASGDVIARVDGHAIIPPGYIRRAVELLEATGAVNVGGIMSAEGDTPFRRAVAAAMSSRLGAGDAKFHTGGRPGAVDTVYLGVFRRDALGSVGGYDERYVRAQDAELNHRLRGAGGTVYFHPDLRVRYVPRDSLGALARQYFHYGRWRRAIVRRHRGSMRWRQLLPPLALLANVAGLLVAANGHRRGLIAPGAYVAAVTGGSALVGSSLPLRSAVWLPAVFVTMHGAWALGFLTSPPSLGRE